jgi:hypothetical protein
LGGTLVIGQTFFGLIIGVLPQMQKMVIDKPITAKGFLNYHFLHLVRIDTKPVSLVFFHGKTPPDIV